MYTSKYNTSDAMYDTFDTTVYDTYSTWCGTRLPHKLWCVYLLILRMMTDLYELLLPVQYSAYWQYLYTAILLWFILLLRIYRILHTDTQLYVYICCNTIFSIIIPRYDTPGTLQSIRSSSNVVGVCIKIQRFEERVVLRCMLPHSTRHIHITYIHTHTVSQQSYTSFVVAALNTTRTHAARQLVLDFSNTIVLLIFIIITL